MCLFSCEEIFVGSDPPNTYATNFELLWKDFDQNYPSFIIKKIDWESIYQQSSSEIEFINNDREFFDLLSKITLNFKDGHVALIGRFGDIRYIRSNGITENTPNNIQNYVSNIKNSNQAISYGDINGNNFGYIRVKTFSSFLSPSYFEVIDEILTIFSNKRGIILDLRSNDGGASVNANTIASRFINNSSCAIKLKYRNGPNHNDLTEGIKIFIESEGVSYTKPIAILTNRRTASASEYFTQSLMDYSNVTIVGDTTSGSLGNSVWRELPNGWTYRMTINLAETCNNVSYEDIGIPPDVPIWISKQDSINGIDTILEKAISILE